MSLEQVNTVDAMGIEVGTQQAVLTIADSWDWSDEQSHLIALQAKLNAYYEFIGSGQVWESYPAASNKKLRIDVVFRFPPTTLAIELLAMASDIASRINVKIMQITHRGSLDEVALSTDAPLPDEG